MKSKFLLSALVLGACVFQACENTNRTSNDPDSLATTMVDSAETAMADSMGMHNNDTTSFMQKAAIGGMMEVELGKMAQEKASNAKVKEFGAMMVRDHTKANAELKQLAQSRDVTLPTSYPEKDRAHVDEMKKMTGDAFDKHYMKMMVDDHAKTIELFKLAAKNSDVNISKFAAKTLPVLEAHHKTATGVQASLK
jgi:putative membrane protein